MKINEYERKTLDEFMLSVEPLLAGYKHASLGYLAIRDGDAFLVIQARLHLLGAPLHIDSGFFESQNVKAGYFKLCDTNQSLPRFIEELLSGKLTTPHGKLDFKANDQQACSISFNPFQMDGLQLNRRQMQLIITGGQAPQSSSIRLDWEVKGAKTPYENIQDLCNQYAVGSITGHQVRVEVLAQNVVEVDPSSLVRETKAYLAMFLVDGLEQSKASLGYRLFYKQQIKERGQIAGSEMKWLPSGFLHRGSIEIDIPAGAILHCFANYSGESHHSYWVSDPSTAQNTRRAVHQLFDDKLEVLQDLLLNTSKGRDARDFESAIAWILWMLGFSVTHLGGTPKTSDALDLIATTPRGNFFLIECTTGILKADKLANLAERAEKVRRGLMQSGNGHLKVIPAVVTNKWRDEVKSDSEAAEKTGTLVITRDGFARAIDLTLIIQDPDQLFIQAENKIQLARNPDLFGPPLSH
jgi:hypothetical protein